MTNRIPPPPEKPGPNECCGSGCVPCIFDYYFDRLEVWETNNKVSLEEYLQQLEETHSMSKQ